MSHASSYCYCIASRHFPISIAPPVRFIVKRNRAVIHTGILNGSPWMCVSSHAGTRIYRLPSTWVIYNIKNYNIVFLKSVLCSKRELWRNSWLKRNAREFESTGEARKGEISFPRQERQRGRRRVLTVELSPWLPIHAMGNPQSLKLLQRGLERVRGGRDTTQHPAAYRYSAREGPKLAFCNSRRATWKKGLIHPRREG